MLVEKQSQFGSRSDAKKIILQNQSSFAFMLGRKVETRLLKKEIKLMITYSTID